MDESTPPPDPQETSPPGSEPESPLGPAVEFLTLGLSAAVMLVAGAGLGYLVDRWASTSPIFTLIGLVLGVAMAVAMTVVQVRRHLR
jgi:F0F1-type ATP synthase assembly protein I